MPFGLTNAPATFQRLMERILTGLQWKILALYLDDIIIFAGDVDEHLQRLRLVFERCRAAGLKLKPKKCNLLKESVQFLGHVVDSEGIKTDPEKVRKVLEWPIPQEVGHVRSFVGLASYYRKFIKDFARIAGPLRDLTKSKVDFIWGPAQQAAFDGLKAALASSIKNGGEFILDTDASGYAIGAVLSQVQDGVEQPLAFGSHCLSTAERNHCVTRRELLAVVYFMDYYRHYSSGEG